MQITPGEVVANLESLQHTMKRRPGGALQLTSVSGRWVMEVKPKLANHIPSSFRTEIPQRLLAAAALIAYHQPMAQSQLVDMIGQRAYEHVRDLAHLGLIDRRRDGLSRRLTTTRRFAEMFGCPYAESRKFELGLGNMQPRWAWMGLNWQPVWVMGIKKSKMLQKYPSVMNGMNPVQKSSKMKKSESPFSKHLQCILDGCGSDSFTT